MACFCPGTRIATPDGAVAVEDLVPGDRVLTADADSAAVRWVGVQTVPVAFGDPVHVLPVRLAAGALGDGRPERDLLLSPVHAIRIGGVLVQAAALVDGDRVARLRRLPDGFRYYHVELAYHALLLAEGVAAESYLEGGDATPFDNVADRPPGAAPMPLDLPRVRSARQLPAALRRAALPTT